MLDAHAKAIERIKRHLASLRTHEPYEIEGLEQKLAQLLGQVPLFPNQFLYVVNYTTGKVVHAQGFEQVLGYQDTEVDLPLIYGTWHPDDAPVLAQITERVSKELTSIRPPIRPFEVTLTLDYRVRKLNGEYIKVQRQSTVFAVDEKSNRTISTFSLCRDISDLKPSNRIRWQWEGRGAGSMSFPELKDRLVYHPTAREREVLVRMANGESSKAIASALGLSLHTVNTHRKNLLQRTGLPNSAALIAQAAEEGWVQVG